LNIIKRSVLYCATISFDATATIENFCQTMVNTNT
jgi:hypothetical protein